MALNLIKRLWNPEAYQQVKYKKDLIVLHHTAGYSATGSAKYLEDRSLKNKKEKGYNVGTAFFISREGELINTFDPVYWAYHSSAGASVDKRSIAIEIANLGYLVEKEGKFFDVYGKEVHKDKVYDANFEWRGYRYWERYTDKQVEALIQLMNHLFERFPDVPKRIPLNFFPADKISACTKFKGVLCHTHLVGPESKWDLSVAFQEHLGKFLAGTGIIGVEV